MIPASGGDDTANIQNALDDPNNTVVTLDDDDYNFNSNHIWVPAGKTLEGMGMNSTTLKTDLLYLIVLAGSSQLRDLNLVGPGKTYTTNNSITRPGVDFGQVASSAIRRCRIQEFTAAGINIWGINGVFANNFVVEDCEIVNNGNVGIQVGPGCWSFSILNNKFGGNGQNGIDCNGTGGLIQGNECYSNGWNGSMWASSDTNGILIVSGEDMNGTIRDIVSCQLYDNVCYSNVRAGIYIAASQGAKTDNVDLNNNSMYSNAQGGLVFEEAGGTICNASVYGGSSINNSGWGLLANSTIRSGTTDSVVLTGNSSGAYWCGWGMEFVNCTPQISPCSAAWSPCPA